MKKVLFIGEINVDVMMGGLESFPVRDREITCSSFEITIGSSTAICSCAYASLGGDASFVGLAGNDDYGDFMVRGMNDYGINTDLIARTDKVRTGVTLNLIHDGTRTQVTYPGTIAEFSDDYIDYSALGTFDHIHIASPYLQTKFIDDVTKVLTFAHENNISTSLDPQWCPGESWTHLDEWLPLVDFFFPNKDEALSISKAGDVVRACSELAGRTACPVVKAGREGVYIMHDGAVRTVPALTVDVVDTTGAGDSFDAGFLYAILEKDMDRLEAARFANAVAGRSCTLIGGVNARSSYDDIQRFSGEYDK